MQSNDHQSTNSGEVLSLNLRDSVGASVCLSVASGVRHCTGFDSLPLPAVRPVQRQIPRHNHGSGTDGRTDRAASSEHGASFAHSRVRLVFISRQQLAGRLREEAAVFSDLSAEIERALSSWIHTHVS